MHVHMNMYQINKLLKSEWNLFCKLVSVSSLSSFYQLSACLCGSVCVCVYVAIVGKVHHSFGTCNQLSFRA